MIQLLIDLDVENRKVVKVTVLDEEGKRPRQRKKKESSDSEPTLKVDSNKLILSDSLLDLIDADAGDRVAINYYTVDNTETFPLVGRSEMFAGKESGNKLTKSNTISFKGNQRDVLLEYGDSFTAEPFKEGVYKLIPTVPISNIDQLLSIECDELEELDDEIDDFILGDEEEDLY